MTPTELLVRVQQCQSAPQWGQPSEFFVSIDLETWGKKPGCAIRSIGATVIDAITGDAVATGFYRNVDDESCLEAGLCIDPETARWWDNQSDSAKAAFTDSSVHRLEYALRAFSKWYEWNRTHFGGAPLTVWGNGKEFDISILEHCYAAVGQQVPWKYWDSCDVRTIVWLGRQLGIDVRGRRPFNGTPHYALDDAAHQGAYTGETVALVRAVWEYGITAIARDATPEIVDGRGVPGDRIVLPDTTVQQKLDAALIAIDGAAEAFKAVGMVVAADTLQRQAEQIRAHGGDQSE